MSDLVPLILHLAMILQAAGLPPAGGGNQDFLLPAERAQFDRENKADGKIRIYDKASQRYRTTVAALVKKEEFGELEGALAQWYRLLEASIADIEAGVPPGKKPKTLIRYEIQLRKAIGDVAGFKTTAGVEQFDLFNSWVNRAEQIRSRIVDVIFKR